MGNLPELSLVNSPHNQSDFDLAGVVSREDGGEIDREEEIFAALCMYFKWERHRACVVFVGDVWRTIDMLVDQDERTISQISVRASDQMEFTCEEKFLLIRFEVFRTCYECELEILSRSPDLKRVVVEAPKKLVVYKKRRAPRFSLGPDGISNCRAAVWMSDGDTILPQSVQVTEVTIFSLVIESRSVLSQGLGKIEIDGQCFRGALMPRTGTRSVLILKFQDGTEAGRYFDFYRLVAHPGLLPRCEVEASEVIALYQLYLDQYFPPERHADIRDQLERTWKSISSGNHAATADYVVTDKSGDVVGASSTSLAFCDGDRDLWALHQLSALRVPENLGLTECLYTWRLDYLVSRPGGGDMVGWYVSRSRWVERIYTKFHLLKESACCLRAIVMSEVGRPFGQKSVPNNTVCSMYMVGDSRRNIGQVGDFLFGVGPARLSVSGGLNLVFEKSPGSSPVSLKDVFAALSASDDCVDRLFVATSERQCELGEIWRAPVDRYFRISIDDAIDLRASVEHSLAVTKAKTGIV